MKSLTDFLSEGSKVFRKRPADPLAVQNWIQEAGDKAKAAQNKNEPPGNRVDSAYDAVHMTALACLAMMNYRTTAEHGHHTELLEAVCKEIGGSQGLFDRLDSTQDLRNKKYGGDSRTARDAEDAVRTMEEFLQLAQSWLEPHIVGLARRSVEAPRPR